jgi:Protein of unknown function (DUF995)
MSKALLLCALLAGCAMAAVAQPQEMTLRDLEGKSPRKLSKDEATQLLTGAKMARISARGNQHYWSNDKDGTFVASSDNRGAGAVVQGQGRPTTAVGKWHISDDGRYCVLIEWKSVPTEEWCRYVLDTSDGHYMVKSDSVGTERVFKFEIKK